MSVPTAPQPGGNEPDPISFEPQVRGESQYDRVTSGLMAIVIGALMVFGWLSLILATSEAYANRITGKVELIEVSGGGGSPEGQVGSTENVDVQDAPPDKFASNNDNEPTDFEEPTVQMEEAVALDAVVDSGAELAEVDLAAEMPNGGAVATGLRRSKIGTGGPGFGAGNGSGDGGVPREQRWSIVYPPGQTPEEYARQLDFFKIELGAVQNGVMQVASNLSSATPNRRTISHTTDKRLFFLYQGQGRRDSDIILLKKAGINPGDGATFQFYSKELEEMLGQLEYRYKHRQPIQIRMTRFQVVPQGGRFGIKVVAQEPLR